ncbi:MAG TPA: META domain-containing protein [Pyrinomonadaceae bacterium]|nr:META domain-containing protein [Pyrinomonadaceae bacterium]
MRAQWHFAAVAIFCLATLAQAQSGLTGIDWRLVSLGPAGAETDVIAGTTVTLKLAEDERVSGSTGCNNYGGTYQVRDNNISFSRIVSTRRACLDQNANEQEHRFLSTLETANRFRLSSNRLTILSDRGRSALNFVNNSAPEPLSFCITKEEMHDAPKVSDYNSLRIDFFHRL